MPETPLPKVIRIGVQLVSADPFWVLVREGIYQRAEQLQIDLVPVEVELWPLPGDKQMEVIEEVLALELHGLVTQEIAPALARLVANAGVPIAFLIETELRHPLVTSPLGLHEVARMAAQFIAGRIDGQGHVLVVGGLTDGYERGASRLKGFLSVMATYHNIQVTHIPTAWRYGPAMVQLSDRLSGNLAPVRAIFGLSDSTALAGLHAARNLGLTDDQTVVVGVNGDPLALAAVLEGSMAATVETPATELGSKAIELVVKAVGGESLPQHFSYNPRLITRENVAWISTEKLVAMASLPGRLVGINRTQEHERLIHLETSLAISSRVGGFLDRQQLYREIVELIRSSFGYDEAQIFLWSMHQREFVLDRPDQEAVRIPLAQSGLLGHTLLQGRPTFIPDMRYSLRFPPDPYWPTTRSRTILPIRQGPDTIGLLDLHSRQPIKHSSNALIGLQALADQLGTALRNAELYGEAVTARAGAERADLLKTRLLANVSHELRTPLNVIEGYSQAALSTPDLYGFDLPAALLKDLQHIYTSGQHLERLINDLLDLSRAEIGELDIVREAVDLRDILADAFESMSYTRAQDGKVAWRLQLPEKLPIIQADPVRLRQILLNLLSNAGKFTASGHIVLGAEAQADFLHLWVEDTGCGIAPEKQQAVFETFNTADRPAVPGQGIGLGLRVTRELIRLHQGQLTLDSTPGAGSTFHVYLPRDSGELAASPAGQPDADMSALLLPDQNATLPLHVSSTTRRAVEYIWRNFDHAFTRDEMAASLGVTPGYLTYLFRKEMGLSPWDFLTRVRIARAKQLLASSTLSITEIAASVGYNDLSYFSRIFDRETGRSPRAFRKQAAGPHASD